MFRTLAELEACLTDVHASPIRSGIVELIVRRPVSGKREVVDSAELDPALGLVGDVWCSKPSKKTPDGSPHPEQQLTLMNARAIRAIAPNRLEWPLAGDQLYVDFNLSVGNVRPGTRIVVG